MKNFDFCHFNVQKFAGHFNSSKHEIFDELERGPVGNANLSTIDSQIDVSHSNSSPQSSSEHLVNHVTLNFNAQTNSASFPDKQTGTCSVCVSPHHLHIKSGTDFVHGPVTNRCPGSHKLPISSVTPRDQPSVPIATPASNPSSNNVGNFLSSTTSFGEPITWQHPQLQTATVKHIPKSARNSCAVYFINLIRNIEQDLDNPSSWYSLLLFGQKILMLPKRSGKRHNLASTILKRTVAAPVNDGLDIIINSSNNTTKHEKLSRSSDAILSSLVTSKIEDGNLKAAVRIICSDDSVAPDNDITYNDLCSKHPPCGLTRSYGQLIRHLLWFLNRMYYVLSEVSQLARPVALTGLDSNIF